MKTVIRILVATLTLLSAPAFAEDCSHFFSVVRDSTGAAVDGATVSIYIAGTTTPVLLYSETTCTTSKANPFLSDSVGNYDFFVPPGIYKVVASKIAVGTFTTDYIFMGTQDHASFHESGGGDEIDLGDLTGEIDSSQIADDSIVNDDINSAAAILESKLSLNYATHDNANDPTPAQKAALAGTTGAPSGSNKYVTSIDPRLTDSRTPTAHASTHLAVGSDPISIVAAQITDQHAGTDITTDLEEEIHASEHENGGDDEISVDGLSGQLADTQLIDVEAEGVNVGTRPTINFIEGPNVTLTVADDAGNDRVNVTVESTASGGSSAPIEVYDGLTQILASLARLTFAGGDFTVTDGGSDNAQISISRPAYQTVQDEGSGLTQRSVLNFEGDAIECVDNSGSGRTDCTINLPAALDVKENDVGVATDVETMDFVDSDNSSFVVESPAGEVNVDLSGYIFGAGRASGSQLIYGDSGITGNLNLYASQYGTPEILLDSDFDSSGAGGIMLAAGPSSGGTPRISMWENEGAFGFGNYIDMRVNTFDVKAGNGTPAIRFMTIDGIAGSLHDGLIAAIDGYAIGAFGSTGLSDLSAASCVYIDSDRWYQDKNCDKVKDAGENYLDEPAASLGDADYGDIIVSGSGSVFTIDADVVNDLKIDWGSGANQVDTDDVPEGSTNKFLSAAQKTDLTDFGESTLHYHASDRALANATGTLPAVQVGNGLTDAQVLDNITISSSGSVDGAAINGGTIDTARLGNAGKDFKAVVIPYPSDFSTTNTGYIYIPYDITVTNIAGRIRGGATYSCFINVYKDTTQIIAANLEVDDSGNNTTSFSSPAVPAGQWLSFYIDSCDAEVTELTITITYSID